MVVAAVTAVSVVGVILVAAPSAPAAPGLGTVVWNGAPNPATLTPSSLPTAQVGDTFAIEATGGGMWVVGSGGQVSAGGVPCDGDLAHCQVSPPDTVVFTVDALGSILVTDYQSRSAVLTLGSGSSESAASYTVDFDGNGATSCSPSQVTGTAGSSYSLPSAAQCIRPGYFLVGWSAIPNATTPDSENLRQPTKLTRGATATFSGDTVLFAVWAPQDARIQVTYDANVAGRDWCWDADGKNVDLPARWAESAQGRSLVFDDNGARTETILVTSSSATPTTAVCKPPFNVLASWNTKADGSGTTVALGTTLAKAWGKAPVPQPLHLYAQWTWPTVTLMGDQRHLNGAFHGAVKWGSSVDVFEDYYSGVRCLPSAGPGSPSVPTATQGLQGGSTENVVYDTTRTSPGGISGTTYYFVATDTLGQPAPHTYLFIGSGKLGTLGSPIAYGKPEMFEGQLSLPSVPAAGMTVVPAGSWSLVKTGWQGSTIAYDIVSTSDLRPFVEEIALPLMTCPSGGVQEGQPVASLLALTRSTNPLLSFELVSVNLVYHSIHGLPQR